MLERRLHSIPILENMADDVNCRKNCALPMALRMGVQLGAFKMIASNPSQGTTSQQIAEKSGGSLILVGTSRPLCTCLPPHAGELVLLHVPVKNHGPTQILSILQDLHCLLPLPAVDQRVY